MEHFISMLQRKFEQFKNFDLSDNLSDNKQEGELSDPLPNEELQELTNGLAKLAAEKARKREFMRKKQIDWLKSKGAKPYKIFAEIIVQRSRADNIYCGINGEVDHKRIAEYLKESAQEAQGSKRDILNWLAAEGDKLANHRGLVKEFLILDQLTNASNYHKGRRIDSSTYFETSLGGISSRTLSEDIRISISKQDGKK